MIQHGLRRSPRHRHVRAIGMPLSAALLLLAVLATAPPAPASAKRDDAASHILLARRRGLAAADATTQLPINRTRPRTILELLESRPNLAVFTRRVYDFPDLYLILSDPNTSITMVREAGRSALGGLIERERSDEGAPPSLRWV